MAGWIMFIQSEGESLGNTTPVDQWAVLSNTLWK